MKAAEAEGESKYLRGVGVAKERQAIVEGLRYYSTLLYRAMHNWTWHYNTGVDRYCRLIGVGYHLFFCFIYYRDCVQGFSHDVQGASAADVMDLLLVTQYFDMLKDLGK